MFSCPGFMKMEMVMMMMTTMKNRAMSQIQYRPRYLYSAPCKAVMTTQIKNLNNGLSEIVMVMMMMTKMVVMVMKMIMHLHHHHIHHHSFIRIRISDDEVDDA